MSMKSKCELLTTVSPSYVLATGTNKERTLNEFVAATGYHRKYVITLLRPSARAARERTATKRRAGRT